MTRLRCGMPEAYLSALVDDALSARSRERVAVHVLHCAACREAVAGLRRTSQLLRGTAGNATPRDRLADRLLAIPDAIPGPDHDGSGPPAPTPPTGPTARRRTVLTPTGRSIRTTAAGLALVVALGAGTAAVGWANAPAAEGPIADPSAQARVEYVAASAQRPLAAAASDVVMTAPAGQLAVGPMTLAGSAIRPGERLTAAQTAELVRMSRGAAARTSYTGDWTVAVVDGTTRLEARVGVRAAAGRGTMLDVADRQGRAVQSGFVAPAAPSRLDASASWAAALAAAVTATDGQKIAGRPAVVLDHPGDGTELTTRWWLDRATGLVLRREIWRGSTLIESGGFRSIRFVDGEAAGVTERTDPTATGATLTVSAAMALRDQGWYCDRAVGGLELLAARSDANAAPGVLALTYGDATRTVTVVQRPGTLPAQVDGFVVDRERGVQVRPGWPTMVTWQSGNVVFTVTSTASTATTDAVVADLPHESVGASSPLDRIRAGWERIGAQVVG